MAEYFIINLEDNFMLKLSNLIGIITVQIYFIVKQSRTNPFVKFKPLSFSKSLVKIIILYVPRKHS